MNDKNNKKKIYNDDEIIGNILAFKSLHEFRLRHERKLRVAVKESAPSDYIQQLKTIIKKTQDKMNTI